MDREAAVRLCGQLRRMIVLGPGEDPAALQKARALVRALQAGTTCQTARENLIAIDADLDRLFSDRKTRDPQESKPSKRALLHNVHLVESSWKTPSKGPQ